MTSWTSGYVTDITYTHGYYSELNPLRFKLALINAGLASPKVRNVCELGFGQGVSTVMHAASQAGVVYWGTDFNPSQAVHARGLADACGAECHLFDQSFEEFCNRDDLPEFDFISLHGIWSWISDANRQIIVDFVRKKLCVGGGLYISYNTQPGWAATTPMRHLLTEHAEQMGVRGQGVLSRVDGAIDFFEKFLAVDPAYAKMNPQIKTRFEKLKEQNRAYLAHEYFNRDWQPMHFSTMASFLEAAKLNFACSANLIEHIDALNLLAPQRKFLQEIPDMDFRETVRDMLVNQQFRRDYWLKGGQPQHALISEEQIKKLAVVLIVPRDEVSMKVACALGEAEMHVELYGALLEALSDHLPKTIAFLVEAVKQTIPQTLRQIFEAIMILIAKGAVSVSQEKCEVEAAKPTSDKLNRHLIGLSQVDSPIAYLASPVTGGAINISNIDQLFLLAIMTEGETKEKVLDFAALSLQRQNRRLLKDGKPLVTKEENREQLKEIIELFFSKRLSMYKKLGVVPA